MASKISKDEVLRLLENPQTSKETIRPYFKVVRGKSRAFGPVLELNPDLVELPAFESAITFGNGWSRFWRRQRFQSRVDDEPTRPVIVSEGDSWFQFPVLIDDIIDHLDEDYLVWSCGAAGDTTENIVFKDAEYLTALDEQADRVTAFLLSAAGNDVIGEDETGEPVLGQLLHRFGNNRQTAEQLINKAALRRVMDKLRHAYQTVLDSIRADGRFTTLPILIHGYDYVLPFPDRPTDPRDPIWADRDEWLGKPMAAKGIMDEETRRDIIEYLIDQLYDMLDDFAAEDPHVHVVDVRRTLTGVEQWADEIHGTSAGFKLIAGKFRDVLKRVVVPRPGRFEVAAAGGDAHGATGGRGPAGPGLIIAERPEAAASPKVMGFGDKSLFGHGFARKRQFELTIGADDTMPYWFLEDGADRGRAVCKIIASGVAYDGMAYPEWVGTGFLIAPNILLTNNHVLNSRAVAAQATAVFDYQQDGAGGFAARAEFRFDPDRLFVSSPAEALDYTFVWIDGAPHERFGHIPFWRGSFIGVPNEDANIIHHPDGVPKRVSLRNNRVVSLGLDDVLTHYVADTEPGSSGAPVFNNAWKLFALHHASTGGLSGGMAARIRDAGVEGGVLNEGIKTSAITADLERRAKDGADAASARRVLHHANGTDSRTGYFGTLGRAAPQEGDEFERVVSTYQGAAADIDVAFWNIEWFNRRFEEKLDDVARIVADLNLDIWAFEETSPEATEALVERMKLRFGQRFAFAASEPDASGGKQTTTVMWNTLTVHGERREWPGEIDRLLRAHSTDPDVSRFEAVEGKVFNRYPGRFHFSVLNRDGGMDPFDFYLVPLHLKAKDEGAKRRRMASNILAAAVRHCRQSGDPEVDWIIGGDVNAPLSTNQFRGLTDAGLVPLTAEDEAGGAITYLKGRYRSLIDTIFLSPGMKAGVGADDFMIIARDRHDSGFIERVSDHRPVMVRLSLAPSAATTGAAGAADAERSGDAVLRDFLRAFREDPKDVLRDLADLIKED